MTSICEHCRKRFEPPASNKRRRSCSRSCAVALAWKDPEKSAGRRASIKRARQTPESRARSTEANNRRWADPAKRQKLSEWNKKRWNNPRTRKKLSKAIKKVQGAPEQRAFYSRMRTEQWATDQEYRRKTIEGMRRWKSSPEARALFSQLLRERWADPVMRAKYTVANAQRNSPELREKNRVRMLRRWREDEAYRATVLEAMRIYHASPEASAAKSARMKALWADPVWRARQLELVASNQNTPERIRRGISVTAFNEATDIMAEVEAVIPRGLPDFMRSDIASDLTLALLEGELRVENLKAEARAYMAAHRKMFPDKWGPISIDAPLPGTDGFTLADTLSNDTPHF